MELDTVIIPIEDLRIREMVQESIEATANLLYAGSMPREDAIDIVSSRINIQEAIKDWTETLVDSFNGENDITIEIMGIDNDDIEFAIPENDLIKLGGESSFIEKFTNHEL